MPTMRYFMKQLKILQEPNMWNA